METNKLIAEFMDNTIRLDYLTYHSSWDLLMPVIEKISKEPLIGAEDHLDVCYPITFGMPHIDGTFMFRFCGFSIHYGETWIEAAYSAVVEFITHYNQQPTTDEKKNQR